MDDLASRLKPLFIRRYRDTLLARGANIDNLVSQLGPYYITDNLDTLLNHGASVEAIRAKGVEI